MLPAAFAYKMLTALNEHVIIEEENYIISRPHKSNSDKEAFSILFYNNTEKIREIADKNLMLEETLEEIAKFNDRAEILIKISGISGEYKMSRYKFSKDNILMSYKVKLGNSHSVSKREKLTNRWGHDSHRQLFRCHRYGYAEHPVPSGRIRRRTDPY